MNVISLPRTEHQDAPLAADVDIVIPVYNEEEQLAVSVTALRDFLDSSFPFSATVTIVDNASTDRTAEIAVELAAALPGVEAIHLDRKGRGLALRTAWSQSTATVVAYMDVDLATGLEALLPLVAPLLSGHSDLAIGSRLAHGAHVIRGTKREFISRGYNLLLRSALRSACTDAQCGFKAMRREAALEILPLVQDDQWFFDTEVLVTAQRIGLRIHEVPVDWVDDIDSRVDVVHTAVDDLRGVLRLLGPSTRHRVQRGGGRTTGPRRRMTGASPEPSTKRPAGPGRTGIAHVPEWAPMSLNAEPGPRLVSSAERLPAGEVFSDELIRFAGVGAVSTMAYAGLFACLEPALGGFAANAVAIVLCSAGNTAAHRGMNGAARHGLDRNQRALTAAALLGVSLSFSTAAIAVTRAVGLDSLAPELCAVTVANAGAAVIRYAILRSLVFRPEFGTHLASVPLPADSSPIGLPA
jgi:hypothetical protein